MKTLYYAIRFLLRTKSYTIINLLGLAFSLACCIILLRYIHRELTVDTHCIDRNQVYGVQTTFEGNRVLSVAEIGSRDSVYIDNSGIVTRSRIVLLENDYLTYQSNRIPVQAMAADSAYFELFFCDGTVNVRFVPIQYRKINNRVQFIKFFLGRSFNETLSFCLGTIDFHVSAINENIRCDPAWHFIIFRQP